MARRSRPPRESRSIETTGRTIDEAVAQASAQLKVSEHDLDIKVLDEGRGGFLGIGSKEARVRATVKGGGSGDRNSRGQRDEPRRSRSSEGRPSGRREERSDSNNGDDGDAPRRRSRRRGRGRSGEEGENRMEGRGNREGRERRERRPSSDRSGGRGRRDSGAPSVPAQPDADFESRAKALLSGILERMGFPTEVESRFDDGAYLMTIQGGDDEAVLIGRKGETLDALQHIVYKAVSRGREDSLTVRIDVAGYRERREEALGDQARELAKKALDEGRSQQTEPLRPAERRTVHRAITDMEGVTSRAIGNGVVKRIIIEAEGQVSDRDEAPRDSRPRQRSSAPSTPTSSAPAQAPAPRREPRSAPVTTGEVLDYVSKPVLEEGNQNKESDSSGGDWGRKARPSKKMRRR